MENRFCLQYCRFDVREQNKLLICGWWQEGEKKDTKLLISLDYTPVPFKIERKRTIKSPKSYVQRGEYEETMFFWVSLPENYRDYEKVRVFEQNRLELKEILKVETEYLEKHRQEVRMSIDEISKGTKGTVIRGWCIAGHTWKIQALDGAGRPVEAKISRQRRPDVENAYPECGRDWIHGFVMETERPMGRRAKIEVVCDGRRKLIQKPAARVYITRRSSQLKTMARKIKVYYQQFGLKRTAARGIEKLMHKERTDYESFRLKYMPGKKKLEEQAKETFPYMPEFSIVVPLYKTPVSYLEDLIRSVKEQTYGKWKLYLSDGSGQNSPLKETLTKYVEKDERIIAIHNEEALRIAENTNRALEKADGDFIVFADHDDTLAPDALYECASALNRFPETDVIYTDEDKLSGDGKEYYEPHFKPDFNLDLLRSANYMCHLYVARKTLMDEVGLLDGRYDGSQDYDFILRCIEKTEHILHIPKILYHWRMHPDSVAGNPESKNYAYEAGRNAILAHYKRVGIDADIEFVSPGFYRTIYRRKEDPLVSIIIPNKDHKDDLEKCIRSVQEKSTYRNFEIMVIENNSREKETFAYYRKLEQLYANVRVLYYEKEFNYSAIQNFAVWRAKGDYVLLLNNDAWLKEKDSIGEMLSYCMREDVGIVGAKLLYPDDTIQHGGVIVGLGGVAGHAFLNMPADTPGYFCRNTCVQNYSAVTAACMMVKKSVYKEAGGMDTELKVAFNDTDFCLRAGELGYKVVYQPFAVWYHDESKTRGAENTREKLERFRREVEFFQRRWQVFLENGDPCYNPNLTLEKHDFSLRS